MASLHLIPGTAAIMPARLGRILLGLAGAACIALPLTAFSQGFPAKPVRIVVPTSPGPGPDQVARLVGMKMSEGLGQPVVIENRAGANGLIGSEFVARSAPDGYTLLLGNTSTHITVVYLSKVLPYDPVKDFTPISGIVEPGTCLAIHPSIAAGSVSELVEYARRNPGKLSYGSSGVGSVFHMVGELFNQATGAQMAHVPYKGVAPAMTGLVGGQIPVVFITLSNALPHARAGRVKILAVLEAARYPRLSDVPAIGESLPGFEKPPSWFGFFGPAGMPQPVIARLHAEIVKALHAPEVRAALGDALYGVTGNTPEQFAAQMKRGFEVYGRAVKAAGLKPE